MLTKKNLDVDLKNSTDTLCVNDARLHSISDYNSCQYKALWPEWKLSK